VPTILAAILSKLDGFVSTTQSISKNTKVVAKAANLTGKEKSKEQLSAE